MLERVPIHVLTGFLGSGKTTVLNHLVGSPEFRSTLVIVNEFGEVGLDHLLVKRSSETTVEMSSGCICCTIREDLRKTLKDVLWRFSRMGIRQFDRVIIETTGLADPAPIIHTITTSPELAKAYELCSIITTVDVTCFARTQQSQFEARKQVAVADILIFTKMDLGDEAEQKQTEAVIRSLNPSAPVVAANHGEVDVKTLFSTPSFSTLGKDDNVKRWLDEEAYSDEHHHHHDHDVNRHGDDISAFCITRDEPLPERWFMGWIALLMTMMGERVLRVKGIVNLEGRQEPTVIHGVQHILYPLGQLDEWPDDDQRTRIVFITNGISKDELEPSLRSLAETKREQNGTTDADVR